MLRQFVNQIAPGTGTDNAPDQLQCLAAFRQHVFALFEKSRDVHPLFRGQRFIDITKHQNVMFYPRVHAGTC
jgi:hypothetical protein